MKTILTATALSLTLAGMAFAQATPSTDPAADPAQPMTPEVMPEAPAEAAPDAQAATPETAAPEAATPDAATPAAPVITDLAAMTEADLVGTRVHGVDDSDLGEVSAVTVDGVGKVTGVVIDVGGFLGIGEKPVALSADQVTVATSAEGDKMILRVTMTEDQLKAMPEYQG